MKPSTALKTLGPVFLALVLIAGACSSGNNSSEKSTTTSTTAASSPSSSGVKPAGMSKSDIIQMQEWLDAVGCDVGNNDGIIGPHTLATLKAFQKGAGLTVDGVYGPNTKAALQADAQAKKKICVPPAPTPNPVGPVGPSAACTSTALLQGFGPEFTQSAKVTINGYGCDAGWAYVYATIQPNAAGSTSIDVTNVMASRNGTWTEQDRAKVCLPNVMPKDIYNGGCTSS